MQRRLLDLVKVVLVDVDRIVLEDVVLHGLQVEEEEDLMQFKQTRYNRVIE